MDDKVFGVISTIGGLVIGWTLNELSYFFRSSRENRKILNQVLFTQLEIRDILRKTNLADVEKQLKILFLKKFPNEDPDGLNNTVGKLFYGFIQNELNNKFSKKIKGLIVEYKALITTVSQIDPFATYSISNKDAVLDYLSYINTYLTEIEAYLQKQIIVKNPDQPEDKSQKTFQKHFEEIASHVTPFLRETSIETIDADIKIVAGKIGLMKRVQANRFLKKSKKLELDSIDIKKIEFYIDSVIGK